MTDVHYNSQSTSNSKYFYKQYKEAHQRIQEAGKRFVQKQTSVSFTTPRVPETPKIVHIPITCENSSTSIPVLVIPSQKPEIQEITRIRVADIKRAVSEYYGIPPLELISERRTKPYVWPRQVAIWLCFNLTPNSSRAIGKHFGGRDPTTILHSRNKVERALRWNEKTQNEIKEIAGKMK